MHFTIPYVDEIVDDVNAKPVQVFRIYINGAHYCSARYSRFHRLFEQLKTHFGSDELPPFPPKKLLKLSETQLEERRDGLEYFLQKVSSNIQLNSSELHEFLQTCQKETKKLNTEPVVIPIYLQNGQVYYVDIQTTDVTHSVMEALASQINLTKMVTDKFNLFLLRYHGDKQLSIIRELQDFEYPFVSLKDMEASGNCRLVVRKSLWNIDLEADIDSCSTALDILFAQVCSEIEIGWIFVADDSRQQRIKQLIERKARKETLQLTRTLDFYGYVHLYGECQCNKPKPKTSALVAVGNFEVIFRDPKDRHCLDRFLLTRIKAWKICTVSQEDLRAAKLNDENNQHNRSGSASISFEYLNPETKQLEPVSITSSYDDQIILLSMCLKSMAEEYVFYKTGKKSDDSTYESFSNGDSYASRSTVVDGYHKTLYFNTAICDDDL